MQEQGGDDTIVIYVQLQHLQTGKRVDGRVVIRDGYAVANLNDTKFMKDLAKLEKSSEYNEKLKALIQHFPDKTRYEIKEIIEEEIKNSGGKLVEKDN